MIQLTPHESRVLGVLIEKAHTTPGQYPMTLNAIVAGANQKSNREPVLTLDEDQVWEALRSLRTKGLVLEVSLTGSRVAKYRHVAREALEVATPELVILTELLLRGPQTLGELRNRAYRMHPLETTEVVRNVLESLMNREEPLVRELAPAPGSRAERYAQLLSPDLHPLETAPAAARTEPASPSPASAPDELTERVEQLENEMAAMRQALRKLAEALGEPDPLSGNHG